MAAPTSRACTSTDSSLAWRCSATPLAMSRTRCASSDRSATSASSGCVQSSSTTCTATSSACADRVTSMSRRMTVVSTGPPLRAMTARRKTGGFASGTDPPFSSRVAAINRARGRTIPPARRCVRAEGQLTDTDGGEGVPAVWLSQSAVRHGLAIGAYWAATRLAASPGIGIGGRAVVCCHERPGGVRLIGGDRGCGSRLFASVRHVDDDRVRPTQQCRPQLLCSLVVEHPLPPAPSDVLGDQNEGDRLLALVGPGAVQYVQVGHHGRDQGAIGRFYENQRYVRNRLHPRLSDGVAAG